MVRLAFPNCILESQEYAQEVLVTVVSDQGIRPAILAMLSHNRLRSFPAPRTREDGSLVYALPPRERSREAWTRKSLLAFFQGLDRALSEAENYLLPQDHILFHPDLSVWEGEDLHFLCLPYPHGNQEGLTEFCRRIFFSRPLQEDGPFLWPLLKLLQQPMTRKSLGEIEQILRRTDQEEKVETGFFAPPSSTLSQEKGVDPLASLAGSYGPGLLGGQSQASKENGGFLQNNHSQPAFFQAQEDVFGQAAAGSAPSGASKPSSEIQALDLSDMAMTRAPIASRREESEEEDAISLFYLLTHFSKDNFLLYRKQKREEEEGNQDPEREGLLWEENGRVRLIEPDLDRLGS